MTKSKCLLFMILTILILAEDTKMNPQNPETCDSSSEDYSKLKKEKKEDLNDLNKKEIIQNNSKNITIKRKISKKGKKY